MNNDRYEVEWNKLVSQLLPSALQQSSVINFCYVFISPLISVYTAFKDLKNDKEYEVKHNGQVVLLEKLLRDFYETDSIYISDGEVYDETFITYSNSNNEVSYQQYINYAIGRNELFIGNDYKDLFAHFVIHLPEHFLTSNAFIHGEAGLRYIVDKYKLAGKVYKISYDV